jgi:hypothetical protein
MAFPLDVIPTPAAELLYLDGDVERLSFPLRRETDGSGQLPFGLAPVKELRPEPRVYRVFDHKSDSTAAIYFNPGDIATPFAFPHFCEDGEIVTPAYWGSHWPLSRGNTTGGAIDDRIFVSPAHSSLMTWGVPSMGNALPKPLLTGERQLLDTTGHSREVTIQRWAWLIARTDAQRDELVAWAHSFSSPPAIEVTGAQIDFPSYVQERRAMRLVVESRLVEVTLKPEVSCVNPVFELDQAPAELVEVRLDGNRLGSDAWAWDGTTLWVEAKIDVDGATLQAQFR